MYVSVSRNPAFDPKRQTHFDEREVKGLAGFSDIITSSPWSPIIWTGGQRLKANFKSCKYAALDFDDGEWTIAVAVKWCQDMGLAAIIGTSKSHQIPKNGKPAVDRFRVVVPFDSVITERHHYEGRMQELHATMPCDKSCSDAARFFWPCRDVVYRQLGRGLAAGAPGKYQKVEVKRKIQDTLADIGVGGLLPPWIQAYLAHGAPHGLRHVACYKLGANLYWAGYDLDDIVALVLGSPLASIGEDDVRRAVGNGYGAAEVEHLTDDEEAERNG